MTEQSIKTKIDDFFSQFPIASYTKGDVLISAESTQKNIYYLTQGHVRQYVITKDGNELTLNIFKPGAFFPMSLIVPEQKNIYTFEAMDDVSTQITPLDAVTQFLKQQPDVMYDLLERLYRGMDGVLSHMEQLMDGTAQKRLLSALIIAAKRFGQEAENGVSISLSLTHQDLAMLTGLTRETVSREITKLKQQNAIDITHSSITITSLAALEKELL